MPIGKNTTVYRRDLSNTHPDAVIGNDCTIHSHVWIGAKVMIGNRVKIQAFVFIPDGVTIEDDVFIAPHVCFTNDRHAPSHGKSWSKTLIKKGASIGANATILSDIVIGENASIGAGSVVIHDVPDGTTVVGNPARPIMQ